MREADTDVIGEIAEIDIIHPLGQIASGRSGGGRCRQNDSVAAQCDGDGLEGQDNVFWPIAGNSLPQIDGRQAVVISGHEDPADICFGCKSSQCMAHNLRCRRVSASKVSPASRTVSVALRRAAAAISAIFFHVWPRAGGPADLHQNARMACQDEGRMYAEIWSRFILRKLLDWIVQTMIVFR